MTKARNNMSLSFRQVIEAYEQIHCKKIEISRETKGFVQLWRACWPLKKTKTIEGAFHYEFLDMGNCITIEIHLEESQLAGLRSVLESWSCSTLLINHILDADNIYWDSEWFSRKKGGRLVAEYYESDAEHIAQAMNRLIFATEYFVTNWLKSKNLLISDCDQINLSTP